ncbi:MAG: hypothetical protein ACRDOJ_08140, partial [Nocardioidaceae bacterium]
MNGRRVTLTLLTVAVLVLTGTAPAHAAYAPTPRAGTWIPNGHVFAVAVHGDRVYIGGAFTSVRNPATGTSVPRGRLAAFDATTGDLVREFDATANDLVRSLAVSADGSRVYAGGDFLRVNGTSRTRLAALDRTGDLVPGWNASATNTVRDLVVQGDALFAVGRFSRMNGVRRNGLARLDASSGQLATSWTAHLLEGRAFALALSPDGTRLVVGGGFEGIDDVRHSFLASVTVAEG